MAPPRTPRSLATGTTLADGNFELDVEVQKGDLHLHNFTTSEWFELAVSVQHGPFRLASIAEHFVFVGRLRWHRRMRRLRHQPGIKPQTNR